MVPRPENPFGLLPEFNTWFNRFLPVWPLEETAEWPYGWGLTTEELEREFLVRVEMPGFTPEEIKLEVLPDRLTVEAEHKEKEEKGKEKVERAYAHVRRVMTLPPDVETEKAEALYRNGILEVHFPRKPEAVGRRLEVKT
jgi:HSP20 family protein